MNTDRIRGLLCVSPSMPHVPVQDKLRRACAGMLQNAGQDLMKADGLLSTVQMMKSPAVSVYKCSFSACTYRTAMQKKNRDRKPYDATDQNAFSLCSGNCGDRIERRYLYLMLLL